MLKSGFSPEVITAVQGEGNQVIGDIFKVFSDILLSNIKCLHTVNLSIGKSLLAVWK